MVEPVLGVVLAGGLARRMGGGDKGLHLLGDRPVLAHVLERLRPQVSAVILNAQGDPARFAAFGCPVVADSVPGHPGPLAGILAGLDWAAEQRPAIGWVVTVPGDSPFLPRDLVGELAAGLRDTAGKAVIIRYDGRLQPVIGLWSVTLRDALRRALTVDGLRRVEDWTKAHGAVICDYPRQNVDPFFNVNTPADLAAAARLLAAVST
ncbi:MAG TPA: molybdenum cofactor guanylyltransferase MobA [Dongiaceae bacterium]